MERAESGVMRALLEDRWIRDARLRVAQAIGKLGRVEEVWLEEIRGFRGYRLTARAWLRGVQVDLWAEGDREDLVTDLEAIAERTATDVQREMRRARRAAGIPVRP
jgi:hypothetical protein